MRNKKVVILQWGNGITESKWRQSLGTLHVINHYSSIDSRVLSLLDTPDKNRQYLDECCNVYVIKIAWSSRLDGQLMGKEVLTPFYGGTEDQNST